MSRWVFGAVAFVVFVGVPLWFVAVFNATSEHLESSQSLSHPSWAKVAPEQIAEAMKLGVPVAFENDLGMRFVLIPAGTFLMGSSVSELAQTLMLVWKTSPHATVEWFSDEGPRHEVRITRAFYMQTTEITNAQYRSWKHDHDSGADEGHNLDGDGQPAVEVSHSDAAGKQGDGKGDCYLAWLNARESAGAPQGVTYRLPTEAEWEYACRAGTTTRTFWGANYDEAYRYTNAKDPTWEKQFGEDLEAFPNDDGHGATAPVGSYRPNGFGLYDMLGNVWEHCGDWYGATYYAGSPAADPTGPSDGSERVLRGGSSIGSLSTIRSACRNGCSPVSPGYLIGFRLVSPLPESSK